MLEKIPLLLQLPDVTKVDLETAVVLILSVGVAFVAITLQFLTVLRHAGKDAVVNAFTWLLLAAFSAAVGALLWQRHGEFFLMLVMEILASGALAGTILNIRYRRMLGEIEKERQAPEYAPTEFENVAAALQNKLRAAREKKRVSGGPAAAS